jgi:asparagine synthase (glutamine-hydrolysing)
LTGTTPSIVEGGRCAIVAAAPGRANVDATAHLSSASGIVTAGQIVLEDPRQLSATLGTAADVAGPALVGAAYEKWRDRCTEHLSGEYAFAVWDRREQTLVSARDGLGIRLLYVAESQNAIVVTNVLAAALCHPAIAADLDEVGLIAFLATGGAADDVRTCYRHVKVVPPGHTLIVRADGVFRPALRRHWQFPHPDGLRRSDDEILEEYRSVLACAVGDRLAMGDTAIFLSGGIDSTTIAAAARAVRPAGGLRAITARYPRYIDDFELPFTRMAARHLDLPLTVIDADQYEPWYEDPADPPLAAPLDEPSLADWRAAVAAAAQHAAVGLYGEDGDALLRPPGWRGLRNAASTAAIAMAAARYTIREKKKAYLGLRWRERLGMVPKRGSLAVPWLSARARSLLQQSGPALVLGAAAEPLPPHPTRPEAQAALASTNVARSLAATIAFETTRRPLELRLPILDSRLLRLVVSVPAIPWSQHKTLPRRAYQGRMPREILDRPKTPLNGFMDAFVAAWRSRGGAAMRPPGSRLAEWVDTREWTRTLQSGAPDAVMAAWRVGALERWLGSRHTVRGGACIR